MSVVAKARLSFIREGLPVSLATEAPEFLGMLDEHFEKHPMCGLRPSDPAHLIGARSLIEQLRHS